MGLEKKVFTELYSPTGEINWVLATAVDTNKFTWSYGTGGLAEFQQALIGMDNSASVSMTSTF
jgi:hypothetical protein